MKEKFIEKRFNEQTVSMIEKCDEIVEKYQEMGLRLTLRQLYYQFVSHDLFPDDHKWKMTDSGRWIHEQVEEYNPPPNPAKVSDPRAAAYIEKFGDTSWEVDALPPEALTEIITKSIVTYVDAEKMAKIIKQENADKRKLKRFIKD